MAKSFSDIKGGDIEGQIKLNKGEKPQPPKEPEPPKEPNKYEPTKQNEGFREWRDLYFYDIEVIAGLLKEVFYLLNKIARKGVPTEHIFSEKFVREILETLEVESVDYKPKDKEEA